MGNRDIDPLPAGDYNVKSTGSKLKPKGKRKKILTFGPKTVGIETQPQQEWRMY